MKKNGFTLVELIIVIAVLAILAAVLIPLMSGYVKDAADARTLVRARTWYGAAHNELIEMYSHGTRTMSAAYKTKIRKQANDPNCKVFVVFTKGNLDVAGAKADAYSAVGAYYKDSSGNILWNVNGRWTKTAPDKKKVTAWWYTVVGRGGNYPWE